MSLLRVIFRRNKRKMDDITVHTSGGLIKVAKTNAITEDYNISNTVLGLGINGKVVQCYSKKTGEMYALKVSQFFFIFFFT